MKYCKNCGAILEDNMKFCSKCGKGADAIAPQQNIPGPAAQQYNSVPYTQAAPPQQFYPGQQPNSIYSQPTQQIQPAQPKNKKSIISILAAAVAIVAVIIAAVLFYALGPIYVKSIDVSEKSITINKGDGCDAEIKINPESPILEKEYDLVWESSDERVATVNGGKITAVSNGECEITVTSKKGAAASIDVTVETLPEKIEITNIDTDLDAGDVKTFSAVITPSDVSEGYDKIQWSSSDESIATVDSNGKVTGISKGSCTITAETENGLSATCDVTVTERPEVNAIVGTWTSTGIYDNSTDSSFAANGVSTVVINKDGTGTISFTSGGSYSVTWEYVETDDGDYMYTISENAYSSYAAMISDGSLAILLGDYMYIYSK